jgi:hypothetical protein
MTRLKVYVLFLLECFLALIIYDVVLYFYQDKKPNIQWGILVETYSIVYVIICFVCTTFLFFSKRWPFWLIITLYCGFAFYVAQQYFYTPKRVLLVLFSTSVGYFSPIISYQIVLRRRTKKKIEKS